MADLEPNKKWDALLRAYAKKPRPEVELHPASRRVLQGEVAKTFGAKREKSRILAHWWVRWPLATAFTAFAVLMVLQNRRFEDSKNQERQAAPMMAARAKAPEMAEKKDGAAEVTVSGGVFIAGNGFKNQITQPAAAPAGAMDKVMTLDSRKLSDTDLLFVGGPATQAVLQSFQMKRIGSNVVVKDKDGSVYSGQTMAMGFGGAGAVEYSFAVHGTNQSLQQAIDFNGRLRAGQKQVSVSGTATVGATNQIRIEAAPQQ